MKFPEYKQIVTLIPGGCPQFLDFGMDTESLRRESRAFKEEKVSQADGNPHRLICLMEEDPEQPGNLVDMLRARGTIGSSPFSPQAFDEDYSISFVESLECFRGEWMPIPFLRATGQTWPDGAPRVECGPSNWARGMFLPVPDTPSTWHLVVLFDTKIEAKPDDPSGRYFALSQEDLIAASEFRVAWHIRDNSWFINEKWVDAWIKERYAEWAKGNRRMDPDDENFCEKYLAYYMTWLDVARRAIGDVRVKVMDSNRSDAIDVDLILDIGNSRTTGILVETSAAHRTNLNDSYLLELRDLSDLNLSSSEPFDTRVEFADISFGNDLLSRRSGRRTAAFAWPSCVRVGPEATRLATFAICAEGNTGMSSPKRYLWDERRWTQSWRYNKLGKAEPMVTRGLFPRQLNEYGTPLFCFEERGKNYLSADMRKQPHEPLFGSYFTRSSLMMFMVAEILTQALVNINSPANRAKRMLSDKPRHLRRIICTVPTAMPVAERTIFQRWVQLAVKLIWHGFGWDTEETRKIHYQREPSILCEWDEASCSHLVLLYNEIMVKHLGNAGQYFRLFGKTRTASDGLPHPSVRVASIDIGGGTSDLSITTHVLTSDASETPRIEPHMEFRDGFNIAGDEVVREVIRCHIIPAIEQEMRKHRIEPRNVIFSLFGRYTQAKDMKMRTRQGQFVRMVAVPVALGILQACEKLDQDDSHTYSCRIGDFFARPAPRVQKGGQQGRGMAQAATAGKTPEGKEEKGTPVEGTLLHDVPEPRAPMPQEGVLSYFRSIIERCGGQDPVDIMAIPITFTLDGIGACIRRTLGDTIASLCEMVHAYDSDILLVTGRPSAWKGVIQTILAKTPLTPDRIIAMRSYHVGSWYPCADMYGCIADPKSTVVVGAILCALSNGYLEGINFDASKMRLTSTARFVGELNMQGQLEKEKIWFSVNDDGTVEPEEREITYHSPITIGYRQLAVDRWPASRYYRLDFEEKSAIGSGPYKVTIRLNKDMPVSSSRALFDEEGAQLSEGEISILDVRDATGRAPRSKMKASLQTLPSTDGYWLDSGIVVSEG